MTTVTVEKQTKADFEALECPICERLCKPVGVHYKNNELKHVSYYCPSNYHEDVMKAHANTYRFRILADGTLEDVTA